MERLVKELRSSPTIEQHFLRWELELVDEQLASLLKLIPTFRAMLKVGIIFTYDLSAGLWIFVVWLRRTIQPAHSSSIACVDTGCVQGSGVSTWRRWICSCWIEWSYQEAVRQGKWHYYNSLLSEYSSLYGEQAWEALMSGPKSTFTEGNYRTFFGMAIEMLVKPWEKMLGIMKFTEVRFVFQPVRSIFWLWQPWGSSIAAWRRTTRSRYSCCRWILVFSHCIWQRSREIPETVSSLDSAQLGCCECFSDAIECARKCWMFEVGWRHWRFL